MATLAATTFSGAFLLFSVQPLLAKWLLPALGGSPGTWAACMVFFQGLLVFGYAYAHVSSRSRALSRWGPVVLALAAIGGTLGARELPPLTASPASPLSYVLGLLAWQVGLGYLLLGSLSPMLQRWAAASEGAGVYRLYAVSNAGSLLALVAYPTLIEPASTLPRQWALWSWATVALSCVVLLLGIVRWHESSQVPAIEQIASAPAGREAQPPTAATRLGWLASCAVPSAFVLAMTSYLTTDIAAVPLLWVVPLALYLLTFIAAFAGAGLRTRRVALAVFLLSSAVWSIHAQGSARLGQQLAVALALLGSASLLAHMQLVRTRPDAGRLTEYYLFIALGGALGAWLVGLAAPLLFDDYYELELCVLGSYLLLLLARNRAPANDDARLMRSLGRRSLERPWIVLGLLVSMPLLIASAWQRSHGRIGESRVTDQRRSLLGALRVIELPVGRLLTHGRIRHGMQLSDPAQRRTPVMYYGRSTALGQVMARHHHERPRRMGIVGLGTGTIAAFGRAGDRLRFYELDPNVLDLARSRFSYLSDSAASIETRIGDGRLALAEELPQRFDIFVLDAFASDAVPVHLLTREAFGTYLSHLAPDGVLLVNVANRHLALDRVVRGAALAHQLGCAVVETPADPKQYVSRVRWALLTRSAAQLRELTEGMNPIPARLGALGWSDGHASLWPLLR